MAKAFIPKRADAWRTCEASMGRCSCKALGGNPCSGWWWHLLDCAQNKLDPVAGELARIEYNRANDDFIKVASFVPRPR